ncbi:MAG: endoglucanase, partial [Lachnospiraceae bacterium]|nr:endoglucanase [Lachnospiraceae bacterium]
MRKNVFKRVSASALCGCLALGQVFTGVNGFGAKEVSADEADPRLDGLGDTSKLDKDDAADVYESRFEQLYATMKKQNGFYDADTKIPYHSLETFMVEAPDYGHESTSEAASYYIWLEAMHGRNTGEWDGLGDAWNCIENYFIPDYDTEQPTNDGAYNPNSPATYASEWLTMDKYPSKLESGVTVGKDPLASELEKTYGNSNIYGMHWLLDVDNLYGFGRGKDGYSKKGALINT